MHKNKRAQRTKNNARPSNSSRSAELLGSSLPNFIGFSAVKDGGYVPVLPGLSLCKTDEIEMNDVDANFQVVLKKMNKKDATTKYKALQEFAVMCKDAELSAVEGMLPFWPRLYSALAINEDHRVRQVAQLAHAAVVKRVGKGIAMYLKQLAGVWFASQHDPYPPVASAASNSFNDTFPGKKVVDAIIHCQREILMYICDNITLDATQSLCRQKNLTTEEMETKYQRVLITSLQGYSFYLRTVPPKEIEKMVDIHQKIIGSNKFWKLVKYDALPVKTAFFNVLKSLIEYANILLQAEKKKTVTTIMNSIDETEPALLVAVWESMLVTINNIEDWYSVVNVEKLVLPKLYRVLRSGGHCCAGIVYPNLLPFISQFPKLNVDHQYLYINLFNSMREGFLTKSVQMSRSEMFVVAISFIECLRYSVLLNVDNHDLSNILLTEQLMPVLEMCLKDGGYIKQVLFSEITHLIRYWSQNRHNENYKSYSYLIQEFWKNLDRLYTSLAHTSQNSLLNDTKDAINYQLEFLMTLKTVPVHDRKNLKVKFCNSEENVTTTTQMQNKVNDGDTEFLMELNNFVNSLCINYFKKLTEEHAKRYVIHLNKLITYFEDVEGFKSLEEFLETQINFSRFYNDILKDWLVEQSQESKHIIELIFSLMKYMNDSKKREILKSLTEFDDIVIAQNVIECAMSKKHKNDAVVRKWCLEPKMTSLLINLAKDITSANYSDLEKNQNLNLLAFEPIDDDDLFITVEGINEIVSILCNTSYVVDDSNFLDLAKLISRIIPLTWIYKEMAVGAVQTLETLFELRLQNCNNGFIDVTRDAWKEGVLKAIQNLSEEEFLSLTKKFAASMWKKLCNMNEEQETEVLLGVAVDFLEIVLHNELYIKADFAKEIILTFLTDSDEIKWFTETTDVALYSEVISGKLYVSSLDQKLYIGEKCISIDVIGNGTSENVENCLRWALLNISLLNKLCLRSVSTNEIEKNNTNKLLLHNLNALGITNLFINVIYSIVLGRIYCNHYKSTKCYNIVAKMLNIMQDNFKQLQVHFNQDTFNEILEHLKVNYSNYGSMYMYLLHFCCTELCSDKGSQALFENYKNSNIFNASDEVTLQSFQILHKFYNWDDISETTDKDIYDLITARNMIVNEKNTSKYSDILKKIMSCEAENPSLLALDCDITQMSWEKLDVALELIRLLTELITKIPAALTYEHWNFILISLALWQHTIMISKKNGSDFKVFALTVAICQLYCALQSLINRNQQEQISEMPQSLLNEWENIFAGDIQNGILQCWMFYANSYNVKTTGLKPVVLLDYLGKAVKLLNGNILFKTPTNVSLTTSVKLSLELLQSPVASIQLGAYHVLKHAVAELVLQDKTTIELENSDLNSLNIKKIEAVLQNMQNIVNTILMDFKLCDTMSCTIQPYTDSYTYTLGYLLSWALILDMCANASGDLLYQYAEILKDNLFPNLLNNIFRLMPIQMPQNNTQKAVKLKEFSSEPSLDFGESWSEGRLDHIVCWLYTNSLRHLPVLARQWWTTTDSKVSAAVDKITTRYVSPMLCQEELRNNKIHTIDNLRVKVHATFREIVALYQMDDTKLELKITLPPNYPLGPVTVESGHYSHMRLSMFLKHQNGSVWDGLELWKKNLDKKFAGVEECSICYSIFHINTCQIPKLSCHTCRHKYHTACLYEWFNISRKSTCPICRNIF